MPSTTKPVVAFGKLVYTPEDGTYPMFPDLNIIVFKEPRENPIYKYVAVCIQLELDVCGQSVEEAKENLKKAIELHFNAYAKYSGSIEEFAQNILNTIYEVSEEKEKLFSIYREAKRDFLIRQAQKNAVQTPKLDPSGIASFLSKNNTINLSPVMAV